MYETLKKYFSEKVGINENEFENIKSLFLPRKFKRRQFLLQKGQVCKYTAFVENGCLRSYTIDDMGEEHILQFAIENWWISDQHSLLTGEPSSYFIDALEDSEVLLIDKQNYDKLINSSIKIEEFFVQLTQNNRAALERRIASFLSMTAEEKYVCMLEKYPNIVQRVPLRHIASYLGITPESLSRIRGHLAHKSK